MIALLRRFWEWLKPYDARTRCQFCDARGEFTWTRDGVVACPSCANDVIRAITNRDMRRSARHNLKKGRR